MPVVPTYPGLYIEELPTSARTIVQVPTSITVFVGYVHPFQGICAEQGRWGEPIRIFDFSEYERMFGGLYNNPKLDLPWVAYAVYQFFLNGGADAYVIGLQPKFFLDTGGEQDVVPQSDNMSGILFTAKQLTDDNNKMTITLRRVGESTPGSGRNDTADLVIAYNSQHQTLSSINLIPGDPNFIETRLAGSPFVKVEPDGPPGSLWPNVFSLTGVQQSIDLGDLVVPPTTSSYTLLHLQDFEDVFKPDGLLDKVDIFNILVLPNITNVGVLSRALAFCESKRAFLIMDPPPQAAADDSGSIPSIESIVRANLLPRGPNAALYFPYLKTVDPVTSKAIELPPSGSVAGIYARTDNDRGVWKAPAGQQTLVNNTTGVVARGRMTDMRQGTLNNIGVNVLRDFPDIGTVVWGARTTISGNTSLQQWWYVPVRRMALFIEQTLLRNLGWVVFEPNDEPLWSAIRISIGAFMSSLFQNGAFQGSRPSEAFLVKCDSTTTTETDIDKGIVNIIVGFRPLKPAEFVIIKIAQLAGQVQT